MNLYDFYASALPYQSFLEKFGSLNDRPRWQKVFDQFQLSGDQTDLLKKFRRETHVMVLAGAWCGDCVNQCPVFEHFAAAAPVLKIRYLDRDAHPEAQTALKINGGQRVPVVVFFSEDGHEICRYGDRTLATYRSLVERDAGEVCGSGIAVPGDPLLNRVAQDWLDEFERVQWMLRLSPRLRTKYGD